MTAFLISTENALFENAEKLTEQHRFVNPASGRRLNMGCFSIPIRRPDDHTAAVPISVSIVEDSEQLRGTLARVISRAEGFRCVSQYPSAEAAIEG